jgi:hypothetical protein
MMMYTCKTLFKDKTGGGGMGGKQKVKEKD